LRLEPVIGELGAVLVNGLPNVSLPEVAFPGGHGWAALGDRDGLIGFNGISHRQTPRLIRSQKLSHNGSIFLNYS